jgi:hypothetical protein
MRFFSGIIFKSEAMLISNRKFGQYPDDLIALIIFIKMEEAHHGSN